MALAAAELAEVAAEDAEVAADAADVAALLAEVDADAALVAAADDERDALVALDAAALADALTFVSSEDKEIQVPVEVSAVVISPMSRTRPDAT